MATSTKKPLTPEREAKIPLWREKWQQNNLRMTAPADRATAEAQVPGLYLLLGLKPPKHIRWWVGSPRALREQIESKHDETLVNLSSLWRAIAVKLDEGAIARRVGKFYKIRRALSWPQPNWLFELAQAQQVHIGQMAASINVSHLAWLDFVRSVMGVRAETEEFVPLIKLAKAVGGVIITWNACYLIERWSHLVLNDAGLPHSTTGPAIRFRAEDLFAYHGVINPQFGSILKEASRNRLTINEIVHASEPFRSFMIDVYGGGRANNGLEKLTADFNSLHSEPQRSLVHDDPDIGQLHHLRLGSLIVAAVRVVNSTPEPDGTHRIYWLRVPPHLQSARTAVAWTFRLTGKVYRPIKES